MNAALLALVAVGGLNGRVSPPALQIDVVVCQGDPLGSKADGTLKYLAEPKVVTQSGRPAYFRAGTQSVGDKKPAEWHGTEIEVLPIVYANGKVWAEVNTRHVEARHGLSLPGAPAFVEQNLRFSRFVTPGEKLRFRIAADSPSSQTWAEVTVTLQPVQK
jgi:hypothetical protein